MPPHLPTRFQEPLAIASRLLAPKPVAPEPEDLAFPDPKAPDVSTPANEEARSPAGTAATALTPTVRTRSPLLLRPLLVLNLLCATGQPSQHGHSHGTDYSRRTTPRAAERVPSITPVTRIDGRRHRNFAERRSGREADLHPLAGATRRDHLFPTRLVPALAPHAYVLGPSLEISCSR